MRMLSFIRAINLMLPNFCYDKRGPSIGKRSSPLLVDFAIKLVLFACGFSLKLRIWSVAVDLRDMGRTLLTTDILYGCLKFCNCWLTSIWSCRLASPYVLSYLGHGVSYQMMSALGMVKIITGNTISTLMPTCNYNRLCYHCLCVTLVFNQILYNSYFGRSFDTRDVSMYLKCKYLKGIYYLFYYLHRIKAQHSVNSTTLSKSFDKFMPWDCIRIKIHKYQIRKLWQVSYFRKLSEP